MFGNSFAQKFHVGDEKIVADQLNLFAEARGQLFPTFPIILRAAVLDRNDGKTRAKIDIVLDQLFNRPFRAVRFLENVNVALGVVKLGSGRIERDENLLAKFVTGFFDRRRNRFERVLGGIELWREPAFVADCRGKMSIFQD